MSNLNFNPSLLIQWPPANVCAQRAAVCLRESLWIELTQPNNSAFQRQFTQMANDYAIELWGYLNEGKPIPSLINLVSDRLY